MPRPVRLLLGGEAHRPLYWFTSVPRIVHSFGPRLQKPRPETLGRLKTEFIHVLETPVATANCPPNTRTSIFPFFVAA